MSVLLDRFYLPDMVHVVDLITDPMAQVIEEVTYHFDGDEPRIEDHDFEAALSPEDALQIRASVVLEFICSGIEPLSAVIK